MTQDPFKEYIRQQEPDKQEKGYAWHTAIGLQAVDHLATSEYLQETARKNIEGEITMAEARRLLDSYYEEHPKHKNGGRTEEADKVSVRIAELLAEHAFSFTPNQYLAIHRRLFQGIYPHAGQMRDYNITKKEWVLNGASVIYGSVSELQATLAYDFSQEQVFSYRGLSMDEIIRHLAFFVSRLWQIHIFSEGNTRTTAVFFIKYLKTLGFDTVNDSFAEHAWYFWNALVRANYNDLKNGVHETTEYLELFLKNLLLDEKNELSNRKLHIGKSWQKDGYLLRPAQREDAENYYIQNFCPLDSEVVRLTGSKKSYTREEVVGFFLQCIQAEDRYDFLMVAEDGRIVGESVINEIDWEARSGNFRIAIFQPNARGKGLGSWAVQATRDFAFGELKLHRLSLDVFSFNERARRAYLAAGFREEGVLRDAVLDGEDYADDILMAMLEEEWRSLGTVHK